MLKDKTLTYVSLFSSAGVGCYGFKQENYKCILTNELLERRIAVQRANHKCEYETGYIAGDITSEEVHQRVYEEIEKWRKMGNDRVDVVIATPPCQGMSIMNQKKNAGDYDRNSLVVQSIKMIQRIKPRFFIFENVPRFMNTLCEAPDGTPKAISQVIFEELSEMYSYVAQVINFRYYGSNSSRERTLVIGVHKSLANFCSPIDLLPKFRKDRTIRQVIGNMPTLEWGAFDPDDFYHQFRTYEEYMRPMVHHTKPGKSAFDNEPEFLPFHYKNGVKVLNVKKSNSKYTRRLWDEVCPTIHTRNDLLASQNTIHPSEDRVYSIRELMMLMSIPAEFRWMDMGLEELNALSYEEKKAILKREESNIRQSIGEAVPTEVFREIAANIKTLLAMRNLNDPDIERIIDELGLKTSGLADYIRSQTDLSIGTLARMAELANAQRTKDEAYFTSKSLLNRVFMELPDIDKDVVTVIEPSVGAGNFLPYIVKRYEHKKAIYIDVFDINGYMIEALKAIVEKYNFPDNVHISYHVADTLSHRCEQKYDLCIGNPPFKNATAADGLKIYWSESVSQHTRNMAAFFLEYGLRNSDYVAMIAPKVILNAPEFEDLRNLVKQYGIDAIIDFNVRGFKGVQIETICLFINKKRDSKVTKVISVREKFTIYQHKDYIISPELPYWIIYRNADFDRVFDKMDFGLFTVFRDRHLSKRNTSFSKKPGDIRVLKSRNISDDGTEIYEIDGYDSFISESEAKKLAVYEYIDKENIYITPNMTYFPRVCKKPLGIIMDGSVAILIPKNDVCLTAADMLYFSTEEFRKFYVIARNLQTRSINIDAISVFWFGKLKGGHHD